MRVLDLFSGIGAFSLGLERAGFRTVAFCEVDPFCRRVLAKHWPDVPCYDDVRTLTADTLRRDGIEVDVICGGFPCQDVSRAGKRAGLSGKNSGLYRELVRAFRLVRPRKAIVENVAALLGDGMGTVLGDLAEGGNCVEWDCVPAQAVGAPHERDRVWIVAHSNYGRGETDETVCARRHSAGPGIADVAVSPDADSKGRLQSEGREQDQWRWSTHRTDQEFPTHAEGDGCGQGRTRRPPDSFAWVRNEARRNAADPCGGRFAFRNGYSRTSWDLLSSSQREAFGEGAWSIWPNEPALQGVDDGAPNWSHRVRATGNTLLPQIPELIGRAILAAEAG